MTSTKYRRGTFYSVIYPTAPSLTYQPREVELIQEKGSHDILTLEYSRASSLFLEVLQTGTPVAFSWNQNGRTGYWVGYVNVVSKQSASQGERLMKVICVGTSFLLKAKSTKVFKNVTVSEAAEQIAKSFRLKFVGEPTTRRFDSLSVAGQSYWEWLQEQAARIGYVMLVRNGIMYFRPADKLIDTFMDNSPILALEPPGPASDRRLWDRTLDSFNVLNGDYLDNDLLPQRTSRVTAGVNPITGAVTGSRKAPNNQQRPLRQNESGALFSGFSEEVVHTSLSAKQAAAEEARTRKFSIVAQVVGQGDPYMHPYSTVLVQGTGVETDGYWVVASVTHKLNLRGAYQMESRVMADGLGQTLTSPFRRADGSAAGKVNLDRNIMGLLDSKFDSNTPVKLIKKAPIIVESQQGFIKLGTIWSGR
jgi:phage protein D